MLFREIIAITARSSSRNIWTLSSYIIKNIQILFDFKYQPVKGV
jgi:hypothetical protein